MSENALTPIDFNALPSTQLGTDDDFDAIAKSADFLARLQLFTKGKAINRGLVRPGHYGIPESEDDVIDLGDSIDVLPLARRPKAIDMSDTEAILTSYDVRSDEFQRIQNNAGERDSGCMFGPSFLVIERSTGRFLEFFCGSKSSRGEAKKLFPFLPLAQAQIDAMAERGEDVSNLEPHGPLPATLKSKLVEKGTYSWHVPVVVKCSTPFTKLPRQEKIIAEITRFLTPPAANTTSVADTGKQRAR